ncbi:branched-chain amino acid ABC transporter substrate-binding protein [Rhodocyclus purpureus]|uniref:branched-chain amino acid ABC transporter substrate-binding protein n=1 Tax=Rhodocyclus purpureus TaxID=1067 RepID=UPI0019135C0E|nr:branched-chain amino acid ABC transporter substrate-binding protein [Rhodocyclus purpureus]
MSNARFPGIMLTLVASLALVACGKEEQKAPAAPPAPAAKPEITVSLGHVAPLTGALAHLGQDNENAARMAIDDLNSRKLEIGGAVVTFKLVNEDDAGDPEQAAKVAAKLVGEKVNGVIGHLSSGTTLAASTVYAEAGIPQVTGSATNPGFTQQGFRTTFRTLANDVQQAKALAEFTRQRGARTVEVIDDQTLAGQGQAEEYRKAVAALGIKVVASASVSADSTDFRPALVKLKAKQPDIVLFAGMDVQAATFLQQLRAAKLKTRFLTPDGACTPEFVRLAGEVAEGQFCSLPGQPLETTPQGTDFKARYAARYGQDVQLYAPYVYDAVMVLADAMQRANSVDAEKYLAELPKTRHPGVSATIEFDEHGDLKDGAVSVFEVKEGKLAHVATFGASAPAETPAAPAASGAAVEAK